MMSNLNILAAEADYNVLQEGLETRFGPAVAQSIVDEIKKVENQQNAPSYMCIKAASEVHELYRSETRTALKKLRAVSHNPEEDFVDIERVRARHDFQKLLWCYLLAQHIFYRLYGKAMKEFLPDGNRIRKEMLVAA